MTFKTIEELTEIVGISRRTVDRKIKIFQKDQPEKYLTMIREGDNVTGKKRILYSEEFIPILGVGREIMSQVKKEFEKSIITPPKLKKSRAEKAQVINIEDMASEDKGRFQVFQAIMENYKSGELSLIECVASNNISLQTFFAWVNLDERMNSIFKDVCKEQKKNAFVTIRDTALKQLKKSIEGYNVDLESISYLQKMSPDGSVINVPQERRVHRKHVLPRSDLIMFALYNRDPEEWKRMLSNGKDTIPLEDPLESLTPEQLIEYVESARKQGLLTAGAPGREMV